MNVLHEIVDWAQNLPGWLADAVDDIMEPFPIIKRKDIQEHGDYDTKLQTLDIYGRMQNAFDSGRTYQTLLDSPPADPRVAHPPKGET